MLGTDSTQFLSAVIGFVMPMGSHHDPLGKEGLASATSSSYLFGTKKYPKAVELFTELEKTGAVYTAQSGSEFTYQYLYLPRENVETATHLLDEILNDVKTSPSSLKKIKEQMKVKLDELKSDDRRYAKVVFSKSILKERMSGGDLESIDKIGMKDLRGLQDQTSSDSYRFFMDEPGSFELDEAFPVKEDVLEDFKTQDVSHYINLEKDLEQKIVYLGFRTAGFKDDSYVLRQVANSLMAGGFTGLTFEEIREKNSAAYYASFSHDLMSSKGMAYMYAGVSEENLVKTIELMIQLFERGSTGDYSQERLDIAKEYFLGRLDRAYDSIEALAMSSLWFQINGKKFPSYDETVDQIREVSIDDISDYFKQFVDFDNLYLTVNGKIGDSVKSKLKKHVKDV